jgi:hypothetical protein
MKGETARHFPWAILALILLSFALRVYRLEASSLRGDEAYTVRYWAQPPADVIANLADHEPHPLGAFFSFWTWKSFVGDSEFAMRMLPALTNVIGTAAMYALTRRLLKNKRAALVAAFLWAINPNLIWHSQDARNYASWAALSVLTLWLLLRAADRSRRLDWVLYIISLTLGLYIFFLEAMLIVVHGLYIVLFRRRALRPWISSMLIVGALSIPWLVQVWALAHSGYPGTAQHADVGQLFTQFFPAFFLGEVSNLINNPVWQIALLVGYALCVIYLWTRQPEAAKFSLLLLIVPTVLFTLAATRLAIFRPRYLIVVTPALIMPLASVVVFHRSLPLPQRGGKGKNDSLSPSLFTGEGFGVGELRQTIYLFSKLLGGVALLIVVVLSLLALDEYYYHYQKAPDWRGLGTYLHSVATADDMVIITAADEFGSAAPEFGYYYSGPAKVLVLPYPNYDMQAALQEDLAKYKSLYLVPQGALTQQVIAALDENGRLVGQQGAGGFIVRQYERKTDTR